MKDILEKFDFLKCLLSLGFFFILAGYYEVRDISPLKIVKLPEPNHLILSIGILFVITSTCLYTVFKIRRIKTESHITSIAESLKGRRFANLVYIFAKDTQCIAMGLHKEYGVHLPPGERLNVYEMPHEKLLEIVRDQIGLKLNFSTIVSFINQDNYIVTDSHGQRIGETEICPSPVWTQLEKHQHRRDHKDQSGVIEHYDFVFLCVVDHQEPLEGGVREDTGWFSINEVEDMLKAKTGRRTFPDVYAGFKAIKKIMAMENFSIKSKSRVAA